MNRIRGNLRLALSQPWAAWALFATVIGVYGFLILMEALGVLSGVTLSWGWAMILMLGGVPAGGGNRHEALGVPLSFTLPGYRESLRRLSFARAARWGVVFSLFLFSFTWGDLQLFRDWPADLPKPPYAIANIREISLNVIGAFLGGMAIGLFWINSALVWFHRRWLTLLFGGIVVVLFRAASSATFFHHIVVWVAAVPLSVFFCVYFWRRLGDMEWVKSGHRAILVHKIEDGRSVGVQTTVSSWVEDLFWGQMRKAGSTAAARRAWGCLYRVFGPTLSRWKWIVVSLPVGVLVLGYSSRLYVGMAFVLLGMFVADDVWSPSSSMLLPEGRREKYYLTIASGAVATLLLIAVSAGGVVLSWLFAALLPPIPLGAHPLQYAGFGMRSVWLACLPVPWVFIAGSIGRRVPILRAPITITVGFLAIGQIYGRDHGFWDVPVLLPVLLVFGWALLPLALWVKYRRWDLVGQRATKSD